jgi:hypothetical protein
VTSSWFFLSTLNYDARSTAHQINSLQVIIITITNTIHTIEVDKKQLLNNVILSTPIVCIVLVILNIFIILHGHTMKLQVVLLLQASECKTWRCTHCSVGYKGLKHLSKIYSSTEASTYIGNS